jgi:hypothetical protein
MKKKRIMSQRNKHGIKVRKMCASCHYKTVDNEGVRICEEMQLKVEQQFVCKKWVMSDGLKNAGRSGGKLKVIRKTLVDEEIY